MTVYDPFTDISESQVIITPPRPSCASCTSCQSRSSLDDVSSISSYEEGWDDHEGPSWNDSLDPQSVASQAGFVREENRPHKKAPSRCKPQSIQKEKPQRERHTLRKCLKKDSSLAMGFVADLPCLAVFVGDPPIPCPPDIEEIDMYMPSVDHKWFTMDGPKKIGTLTSVTVPKERTLARVSKNEVKLPTRVASRKGNTKGCGYSCKLQDVRRSGLVKSGDTSSSMVEVNRGAW